jgi:hypothetical protein
MTTVTLKYGTTRPGTTCTISDVVALSVQRFPQRELWSRYDFLNGSQLDNVKGYRNVLKIVLAFWVEGSQSDFIKMLSTAGVQNSDYGTSMLAKENAFDGFLFCPYKQVIIGGDHPDAGTYNVITDKETVEPEYEGIFKKYDVTFIEDTLFAVPTPPEPPQ